MQFNFKEGEISRKMFAFCVPIFIGNIVQSTFQLTDSWWAGVLLDDHAVGAIGLSSNILFAVISFVIGMNGAVLPVLAQLKGRGHSQQISKAVNTFALVLFGVTLIVGIAAYIGTPWLLEALDFPDEIVPLSREYLNLQFLGLTINFGFTFVGTVLRGLGDSFTPLRYAVMAVVLNFLLNPVFILTWKSGIAGSSAATVISQAIVLAYAMKDLIAKKIIDLNFYKLDVSYLMSVFRLGLPGGFQLLSIGAGMILISTLVAQYGPHAVIGYGAAIRIEQYLMLPALTIGSAVTSMAGQNIGAYLWDRVHVIVRSAALFSSAITLLFGFAVYMFAFSLIRIFVQDEISVEMGAHYIRVLSLFYVFVALNFVVDGVVRSAGALKSVFIMNAVGYLLLRVPLSYFFGKVWGVSGLPWGLGLSFFLSFLMAYLYYLIAQWKKVQIT